MSSTHFQEKIRVMLRIKSNLAEIMRDCEIIDSLEENSYIAPKQIFNFDEEELNTN